MISGKLGDKAGKQVTGIEQGNYQALLMQENEHELQALQNSRLICLDKTL